MANDGMKRTDLIRRRVTLMNGIVHLECKGRRTDSDFIPVVHRTGKSPLGPYSPAIEAAKD
jgi:hypothetical protein